MPSRSVRVLVATCVVLGVAPMSCGSSDKDKGAGDSCPTSDGRVLGNLNDAEKEQVCTNLSSCIDRATFQENLCKVMAVTSSAIMPMSDPKATCTKSFDSCMAPDGGASASSCNAANFPQDCTATVGEYSACLKDMAAQLQKTAPSLSCESPTMDLAALLALAPESCKAVQQKCPNAVPSESDSH